MRAAADVGPEIAATALRRVELSEIDDELRQLWGSDDAESGASVRACMSNLIVFCVSEGEVKRVEEELPDIAREHPSRVLLLLAEADAPDSRILGDVSVYCFLGGARGKICSERITLHARGSSVQGLPAAVRPLLIGDLPTALWWTPIDRSPAEYGQIFEQLAGLADHVVYDSRGWLDPVRSVVAAARCAADAESEFAVFDLAWRGLEPWRRLLAECLDPSVRPGALSSIREVRIEHGPHALPKAWLLIGWLAQGLGWRATGGALSPGVQVTWRFQSEHPIDVTIRRRDRGAPDLYVVSVAWSANGTSDRETFERLGPERVGVVDAASGASSRGVAVPRGSRSQLVARELPVRNRQPVFRKALVISRVMAEALLR